MAIGAAARIGVWALTWRPMRQLAPRIFGAVELDEVDTASAAELRRVHTAALESWRRVDGVHRVWRSKYFDYDKFGEGHHRFVPPGLPTT